MSTGTLYIVSTPIGNLEDITLRAIRVLKEVDLIAAEDTRHTRHLLDRYEITTPLTSYHDHNKEEKAPVLVARLLEGRSVALVSDAGTPGISDPGYFLINLAADQKVPVVPVPGATAAIAAAGLERFAAAPLSPAVADSAVRMADLCVLGQWRQAAGNVAGARTAVSALRRGGVPAFPVPVGANPRACAELIDASLAVAASEPGARAKLAHLDSMMLSGPTVGDAMRYANLVVARQYNVLGEPSLAMAALQRRSFMRGWPRYRATGLKLQVSLALALRDSAKAKSAADRLEATSR